MSFRGDHKRRALLNSPAVAAVEAGAPELPVTANLVLHYKYNTGVTHDGSLVSQWDDQSGGGHHATQTTETNKPSWISASNDIYWDGVDNYLTNTSFKIGDPPADSTVYFIFKRIDTGAHAWLISNTSGRDFRTINTGPPDVMEYAPYPSTFTDPCISDTWYAIGMSSDYLATGYWMVGSTDTPKTVSSMSSIWRVDSGVKLGSNFAGSGQWLKGYFREVVAYSVAHDTTTMTTILEYLEEVIAL